MSPLGGLLQAVHSLRLLESKNEVRAQHASTVTSIKEVSTSVREVTAAVRALEQAIQAGTEQAAAPAAPAAPGTSCSSCCAGRGSESRWTSSSKGSTNGGRSYDCSFDGDSHHGSSSYGSNACCGNCESTSRSWGDARLWVGSSTGCDESSSTCWRTSISTTGCNCSGSTSRKDQSCSP